MISRWWIYSHGGITTNCTPPRGAPPASGPAEDCDADRNLTPTDAIAIARTGGVIGIGYWSEAVGRRGIPSVVAAMDSTAQALAVGGVAAPLSHLAIGSDFDGFVRTAVDASGHPKVLGALEDRFGRGAARMVGWVNACRALARAFDGPKIDVAFCDDLP